jgi:hypothetical protein
VNGCSASGPLHRPCLSRASVSAASVATECAKRSPLVCRAVLSIVCNLFATRGRLPCVLRSRRGDVFSPRPSRWMAVRPDPCEGTDPACRGCARRRWEPQGEGCLRRRVPAWGGDRIAVSDLQPGASGEESRGVHRAPGALDHHVRPVLLRAAGVPPGGDAEGGRHYRSGRDHRRQDEHERVPIGAQILGRENDEATLLTDDRTVAQTRDITIGRPEQ